MTAGTSPSLRFLMCQMGLRCNPCNQAVRTEDNNEAGAQPRLCNIWWHMEAVGAQSLSGSRRPPGGLTGWGGLLLMDQGVQFTSVQLLSCVPLLETPLTAPYHDSLSFTIS